MLILNTKLRRIKEEIEELEEAIDTVSIYDYGAVYTEHIINDYTARLINLSEEEARLEKKIKVRNIVFFYAGLLALYIILNCYD